MKVFKFGGASVKDAQGVINVKNIISLYKNEELTVVISAMGKTTNLMEEILKFWYSDKTKMMEKFNILESYHYQIASELEDDQHSITTSIEPFFQRLKKIIAEEPSESFDYEYDKIVPFGEYGGFES